MASDAERVLFGGFSAGGLGASVHADAVRARLRRVRQFGVLAASGFFWPGAGTVTAPSSRWSSGPFLQRLYDFHRSGGSPAPRLLDAAARRRAGAALRERGDRRGARADIRRALGAGHVAARQCVGRESRVRRQPFLALRRRRGAPPQSHPRHLCRRRAPRRRARGERRLRHLVPAALGRAEARLLEVGVGGVPMREAPAAGGRRRPTRPPKRTPTCRALREAPANGSHNCEPSCAKGARASGRRLGSSCPRRLGFPLALDWPVVG